ncbi:hypothetical protein [Photobacterium damselae]|uniref:hypothetical protein n=1 Tax=Photobacterium damselae TaxID=38293 RepID=UPI00165E5A02|nr:hypothetical protein [Photobacterium damselae]
MKTKTIISLCIAVLAFAATTFGLCYNQNVPFYQCPIEAVNGMAFSFAWGLGIPTAISYALGVITLLIPPIFCFYLARTLYEKWFTN